MLSCCSKIFAQTAGSSFETMMMVIFFSFFFFFLPRSLSGSKIFLFLCLTLILRLSKKISKQARCYWEQWGLIKMVKFWNIYEFHNAIAYPFQFQNRPLRLNNRCNSLTTEYLRITFQYNLHITFQYKLHTYYFSV